MTGLLREGVHRLLHELRPEADLASLGGGANLRDELDLDSMDFLNFVIGLDEATGVDIPEADYAQLETLDDCVRYLEAHGAAG
jgi:acyl carrier protein